MPAVSRWPKPLRSAHLYLGIFSAPALLFFAITGALQSVNLHEASRSGGYTPPAWLAHVAHLHKKQSLELPVRPKPTVNPSAKAGRANVKPRVAPPAARRALWPMKAFFVVISLSLMLSVLSGLTMSWRHARSRRRFGAALGAGVLVPVVLLVV
ncbi:MAG TPA: hypothetical protein VFQ88_09885 [Nevskiaceae bacterium]|nr:hypothetical protein [Nevskiaceae bacterium]